MSANGRNSNKRLISVRINNSDHLKIKQLAKRMGVGESDVIRFAVKTTLAKLNPLYRPEAGGKEVFPVFIEQGQEIVNHFDLDTDRLHEIINAPVTDPAQFVDPSDIELIVAAGVSEHYLNLKLNELKSRKIDPRHLSFELSQYLVEKYIDQESKPEHTPSTRLPLKADA